MRLRRPHRPYGFKPEVRIRIEELANKIAHSFIEKGYKEVFCKPIRFEKTYIGFILQYSESYNVIDTLYVYRDSQDGLKGRLSSEYNIHYMGREIIVIDSYQDIL